MTASRSHPCPRRRRLHGGWIATCLLLWLAAPLGAAGFDFTTRILPILTHAGCNAGACHGAATGQGGFRLSLLGYAPELDHAAITREWNGRRIDIERPAESLLLRKATARIPHEGDRRIRMDSPEARLLLDWIREGAPFGNRGLTVTGLVVQPGLLRPAPGPQPITVTARLSDGSSLPATSLALFTSNNEAVAEVDRKGLVRVLGPGLTSIMVRFGGAVAAVTVEHPYPGSATTLATASEAASEADSIDAWVDRRLRDLNLPASPRSSATEFLRRVHIDLTGRLPEPEQVRAFLGRPDSPAARAAVVDGLLASEAFTDLWTQRFAELLLVSGRRGGEAAARSTHRWLRARIAADSGWDAIARELVTATGPVDTVGATSLSLLAEDPRDLAEHAASILLGTRIGCARCHAHPADRWTRTDYHRFAAFFARVRRVEGRVLVSAQGEIEDPQSGHALAPRPLGGVFPESPSTGDRRVLLADWMAAGGRTWVARAFVNRVWGHLFGRGLVEPVDDLRPTNPPTHPELLDWLVDRFIADGTRLRPLVRILVLSEAYQRRCQPLPENERDDRLLSHARLRPPDARVFLDLVCQATGVPEVFPDQPDAANAVQLVGTQTPSQALDILGRCSREAGCATGDGGGGLALALHLINGQTVQSRLTQGRLPAWLKANTAPAVLLDNLYLHTLSRPPSPSEQAFWVPRLDNPRRDEVAADLLWALLNSREFAFNH